MQPPKPRWWPQVCTLPSFLNTRKHSLCLSLFAQYWLLCGAEDPSESVLVEVCLSRVRDSRMTEKLGTNCQRLSALTFNGDSLSGTPTDVGWKISFSLSAVFQEAKMRTKIPFLLRVLCFDLVAIAMRDPLSRLLQV